MQAWLRVWTEKDLNEIRNHLLIVGDVRGDCAACREFNLDYKAVKHCPQCGTTFQYVTSRRFESHPRERFRIVKQLNEFRRDLVWVDYEDFMQLTGRQRAKDFFLD